MKAHNEYHTVSARKTLLMMFAVCILIFAGCVASLPVASLEKAKGKVEICDASGEVFRPGKAGDNINSGGAVRTGEDGEAVVTFTDGLKVRLRPDSHFQITGSAVIGRQYSGSALFTVPRSPVERTVETPNGLTTITGTIFAQEVASETLSLFLEEGMIAFTDVNGVRKNLQPGQQLIATIGEPLPEPATMTEAVRKGIFHPEGPEFLKEGLRSRPFIQQF